MDPGLPSYGLARVRAVVLRALVMFNKASECHPAKAMGLIRDENNVALTISAHALEKGLGTGCVTKPDSLKGF
jgi:hypothetical protein